MNNLPLQLLQLWQAWPIAGPWQLSALQGGINNLTWRAEAADGQVYVLRLNPDRGRISRARYEAAVLEFLSQLQLPFLLPCPIKACDGDSIVFIERKTGDAAFATLAPLLPGHHLQDRNDLVFAAQAGIALACLDRAMADLPTLSISEGSQSNALFGELASVHPLVPEPLMALEGLSGDQECIKLLQRMLEEVYEQMPDLCSRLPQQVLHCDYDPSNILVDQSQVTAVLDFEFVGRGVRALDLCVALSWWPVDVMGTGKEWEIIDAFGQAYTAHFPLEQQELLALPDLMRLRDATSLLYRIGRYRAGLVTNEAMQRRLQHSLWRENWISTHQKMLVQRALAWEA